MAKKLFLVVVVFLLCIAWSSDPDVNTPVCTAPGLQSNPKIVSDGSGGYIIAWSDNRGGDTDIYMQRLSASGAALWGTNGRVVYSGADTQFLSHLIADGSGGALLAVGDEAVLNANIYDAYVKRVSSQGNVVWTSNVIDDSVLTPTAWPLVPDGSGGALIFWRKKLGGEHRLYGQHIDSNGSTLWAAGGLPLSSREGRQYRPESAVSDGRGGAYVAWINYRDYPIPYEVLIQRIDGSGNLLWGQEGIMVTDVLGFSKNVKLYPAAGQKGVYAAWNYGHEVYMQRFNAAGNRLWAASNVLVYRNPYYWLDAVIIDLVSDGGSGVYMLTEGGFTDLWGYTDYEAGLQHIDSSGNTAWGVDGVSIISDRHYRQVRMTADGSGNALVVREDVSGGTQLKAQLVDASGAFLWPGGGPVVSGANYNWVYQVEIISNGAGGAVVVWANGDYSIKDIYAQNICASGGIGACAVPIAVIEIIHPGGIAPATITFDGSRSYDPDGKVKRWHWNLGDETTATTAKVTHTYENPGTYDVTLRVKDDSGQWSKTVMKRIKVFSLDALEAIFDFYTGPVKSRNKGYAVVRASLYDKPYSQEERPIPADLGLIFETDKGNWQGDMAFSSAIYSRALSAETEGTATISAVLEGKVLAAAEVAFAWLLPPAKVTVDLRANRSLFRGEYYAHISWSLNPAEVFTPAKYRVYRSTDGGVFDLVGEVDAAVFSFVDEHLPAGRQYVFAVSMVDDMGDESDLSTTSNVYR